MTYAISYRRNGYSDFHYTQTVETADRAAYTAADLMRLDHIAAVKIEKVTAE